MVRASEAPESLDAVHTPFPQATVPPPRTVESQDTLPAGALICKPVNCRLAPKVSVALDALVSTALKGEIEEMVTSPFGATVKIAAVVCDIPWAGTLEFGWTALQDVNGCTTGKFGVPPPPPLPPPAQPPSATIVVSQST
jgi:hypothetical protein